MWHTFLKNIQNIAFLITFAKVISCQGFPGREGNLSSTTSFSPLFSTGKFQSSSSKILLIIEKYQLKVSLDVEITKICVWQ